MHQVNVSTSLTMVRHMDADLKIKIILLNYEHLLLSYHRNSLVEEIFHEVCNILDIMDRELFGLAIRSDESYLFLDPNEKLTKINFRYLTFSETVEPCNRLWQPYSNSSYTSDRNSSSESQSRTVPRDPVVYFRLRFYVPIHCLRDRSTQHAYYEQLRANVLEYGLCSPIDVYLELAALALQSDVGNSRPVCAQMLESKSSNVPVYFDPTAYFPPKLLAEVNLTDLVRWTFESHVNLQNMTPHAAEFRYIRLASKKGSNFNMHLYSLPRLRQPRFSVWLGVSPDGLMIHQQDKDGWIRPSVLTRWKEIDHLSYKNRSLLVYSNETGGVREFLLQHSLTARHLFALISHMHFYQATAELSAPHAAGLLELIERGPYEERHL